MTYLYPHRLFQATTSGLLAAALLAGCGGGETTTTDGTESETGETGETGETAGPVACTSNLVAGDLVITEVMANPSGSDDGFEWFEVYNPGDAPVPLAGVNIVLSRSDGSSEKQHAVFGELAVPPGGYITLGNIATADQLDFIDYAYADTLGNMSNGGGWLRLRCGDEEIDSVTWLTDHDGASHSFDGFLKPPDTVANDDLALWCEAQSFPETFLTGDLGTPQLPNDFCPPPAGFCYDGDNLREVDAPGAGDLVINEIMPDPQNSDDTEEWFEVYVTRDLDLNGLVLARSFGGDDNVVIAEQAQCERVTAGDYLVFAVNDNPAQNGGLPVVDYLYKKSKLNLVNADGSLSLAHAGELIDEVSYPSSESGQSLSLDPDMQDASLNDTADIENGESAWCLALGEYGPGNQGTPGSANTQCGQCIDAMGTPRDPNPPMPGDLVITEFMANPAGSDGEREWVEIYVGDNPVDLMHVQIAKGLPDDLDRSPLLLPEPTPPGACLEAPANTYLVLAKELMNNGDLPTVDFLYDLSLSNSGMQNIYLYQGADILLDEVAYTELAVTDGASRAFIGTPDPELNDNADDDMMWCTPMDLGLMYGEGGLGTPGQPNQCE